MKNEADIIEAMIRLNLRFLDHIHIIDNGSSDGTLEILADLAEELPSVSVASDPTPGHPQTDIMNRFLAESAGSYNPYHVIPLDGDEILVGDPGAFREECAAFSDPIHIDWRTYVPTEDDRADLENPVQRIRWRRDPERPQYRKSTVPKGLIGRAVWSQGSHKLLLEGRSVRAHKSTTVALAHFPVRSIEQITAKALIGHWGLLLRGAPRSEGKQWREISAEILRNGALSQETFLRIGRTYATRQLNDLLEDPVDVPENIEMRCTGPAVTSALHHIATFAEQLVNGLNETKSRPMPRVSNDAVVRVVRPGHIPKPSQLVRASIKGKDVEFCVTHHRDEVQKHHMKGQFYEREELDIIGRYFKRGGTFFDIGANVGNHSVYCAMFLNPRQVILAEPNPDAIRTLTANVQLNGLKEICDLTGLGVGIGAESTNTAAIEWRRNNWQKVNLGGATIGFKGGDLEIMRGDDFLGARDVDFIKIDVEGMEISVLEGLTETISKCRPTLFVEVDNINAKAFSSWLRANGYIVKAEYSRYPTNCNYLCEPKVSFDGSD